MVRIPTRLEDLLPAGAVEKIMDALHQPQIAGSVREALNRAGLDDRNPLGKVQEAWQQARSWLDSLAVQLHGSTRESMALNATGSLLHEQLAGVPMATSVSHVYAKAATTFQLESGVHERAAAVVNELGHGPAGAWISHPAAALQIIQTLAAADGGVVISRADLVRVQGFGDIRQMLTAAGQSVIEVGAATGASESDWRDALGRESQIVFLVSPNGLSPEDAEQQRAAAARAAQAAGARVVELLIDGVVSEPLADGHHFPLVQQRVGSGSDLVLLPLHLLTAGPVGLLAYGDKELCQRLAEHARRLGATLSAAELLAACLAIRISRMTDEVDSGIAGRLLASEENLKDRAHRLAVQLRGVGPIHEAHEEEHRIALGPPPWDRYQLDNWSVRLVLARPDESVSLRRQRAERLRQRLATSSSFDPSYIPILARLRGDDLVIDLRFVSPADDHEIVTACRGESSSPAETSDE